jgi:uncharacterized delta-60 repeat protein
MTAASGEAEAVVHFDTPAQATCCDYDAQGRLVVAGDGAPAAGGEARTMLCRLNPDGSLDTSFSADGKVSLNFHGGPWEMVVAVAHDQQGRILALVEGGPNAGLAVVRFSPAGQLDGTWGTLGAVRLRGWTAGALYTGCGKCLAFQPDGRLLVAGSVGGNFAVARLLP